MAIHQQPGKPISLVAAEALVRNRFVILDANGEAAVPTLGAEAVAVTLEDAAAGDAVSCVAVADGGFVEIEVGTIIGSSAPITTTATGAAQLSASGHVRLGYAVQTGVNAGELVRILLDKKISPQP